jgi:hypothetical protein
VDRCRPLVVDLNRTKVVKSLAVENLTTCSYCFQRVKTKEKYLQIDGGRKSVGQSKIVCLSVVFWPLFAVAVSCIDVIQYFKPFVAKKAILHFETKQPEACAMNYGLCSVSVFSAAIPDWYRDS